MVRIFDRLRARFAGKWDKVSSLALYKEGCINTLSALQGVHFKTGQRKVQILTDLPGDRKLLVHHKISFCGTATKTL